MTQHPITPPPELAAKWVAEIYGDPAIPLHPITLQLVERAAQWGADQELEACCVYLVRCAQWEPKDVDELRAARRPKPPTLKQRAQRNLANMIKNGHLSPDLAELFTAAVEMAPDE
jgi:hypothetical protein